MNSAPRKSQDKLPARDAELKAYKHFMSEVFATRPKVLIHAGHPWLTAAKETVRVGRYRPPREHQQ